MFSAEDQFLAAQQHRPTGKSEGNSKQDNPSRYTSTAEREREAVSTANCRGQDLL